MAVRIQNKNDTAANWTSNNPTLLIGELGFESDTGKIKAGDGSTDWNSLDYLDSAIDHDSLTNFVADEHIDHTEVTLTAGKGLSGGGDISANRTFNLDPSEMTGNVTWDDGSTDASITWTYALSGATDPVWTIGNNSMDLSTGALKQGGTQVLLVGDAPTAHTHDGDTLQLDGVNSDGGAFNFTTSGVVTFSQAIAAANYGATNKLTACATNAGALDFSAGSKTLTVEDDATVSQDYSSDGSPTFAGLDLTGITNGNVPYMSASGFADSIISTDSTHIGIGTSLLGEQLLDIYSNAVDSIQQIVVSGDYFPRFMLERRNGVSKTDSKWELSVGSNGLFVIKDVLGAKDIIQCSKGSLEGSLFLNSDGVQISPGGTEGFLPNTVFNVSHTSPYASFRNITAEDGDGGRESRIIALGIQSGNEETVLGYLEFSHDGDADDQNGMLRVYINDGNDGISPTLRTKWSYDGNFQHGDGGVTNYVQFASNGDQTFTGSAGFYPRVLNQAAAPAAGTGATQCDTGELVMWTDTDDSKCYMCYNHGGTVKTVELS